MASNFGLVESAHPESGVLDLTRVDDRIDSNNNHETENRKLLHIACENQSTTQNLVIDPQVANTNYINQNSVHVENDFSVEWGPNVSAPQITGVFGCTPNNFYSSSVSTDAITSASFLPGSRDSSCQRAPCHLWITKPNSFA
ncbi:Uncharacterized protein Adt_10048 [Abeliophyllum distichum]|uniref:Uncharacterized protein n=1 Tax=Abeliophyllum distichum TaxID=126358 RepID=A0ABD1UIW4_9LAMI